jgi:hypothetical protein
MSVLTEVTRERVFITQDPLDAIVEGKDEDGQSWKEIADAITYSVTGAAFYMPRECKTGQLISLMLQLPVDLRCYDHDEEFYRVWGLVQHSQQSVIDGVECFHVGIAFIGKNAPTSYHDDPSRSYRVSGMNENGLWKVAPLEGEFKTRKDIRYWEAIEVYLALVNSDKRLLTGARSLTENISRGGASVISMLDANVGDRVKFISEEYDFSGLAIVCNRRVAEDRRRRLHLQFVDAKFPVEKLKVTEPPKL